jgi:hypothetical protein
MAIIPAKTANRIPAQKNVLHLASSLKSTAQIADNVEITANGSALSIKQPNALEFVPASVGER